MRRRFVGSFPRHTSGIKDRVDFLLTRVPSLYLWIELRRRWINWDKRVYLFFVRKGDVVLDIGANIGTHTVFVSHLAGSTGHVLAFEPISLSMHQLRERLGERGRFRNVKSFQLALGAPALGQDSTIMQVPGEEFTHAALARHGSNAWTDGQPVTTFAVSMSSVDQQTIVRALERVDFIKVDVEGAELDVLRGARDTIRRFQPLIYCEIYEEWTKTFGYAPADLFSFLFKSGYTGARIFHNGQVSALEMGGQFATDWFATSADALFFTGAHARRISEFDRRFRVALPGR